MVVVESAGECVVSLEEEVSCRFQPNGGQGSVLHCLCRRTLLLTQTL
jgi:hypothetical protein